MATEQRRRYRLEVKAGDRVDYPVTFYDDGTPLDLTGTAWRAEARNAETGAVVATFALELDDQTTHPGEAFLRAEPAESAKLTGAEWLDVEETTTAYTWLEFWLDVSPDAAHA